jgi:hypothetical protein
MSKNEHKVYKNRIVQLGIIRGDLNLGLETWEDMTRQVDGAFVENEIDLPAPPEPPATEPASAMTAPLAPGVSNAMLVSAEVLTAAEDGENQDPNAFVGLGSNLELRVTKEADAKHRSRHGKKRALGSFAQHVAQQNDAQASTSIVNALRSTGTACDTMHFLGLTEGQPRQTIICIVVNQIADPLPQGGKMKASDCVRLKTQVTLVGRDNASVKWALRETMKAGKHRESPTHDRIDLFQDTESNSVLTTIDRFIEEKKQTRQQPPKKICSPDQVVGGEHDYFRSPVGLQDPGVTRWPESRL